MTDRLLNRSLVPWLFGDVMAGAFRPPSDPRGDTHELGRLMAATYQLGGAVEPRDIELKLTGGHDGLLVAQFTPPWAKQVEARALFHDMQTADVLAGLCLVNTVSGDHLGIGMDQELVVARTIAGQAEEPDIMELALGDTMFEHRQRVTGMAQRFFDAVEA